MDSESSAGQLPQGLPSASECLVPLHCAALQGAAAVLSPSWASRAALSPVLTRVTVAGGGQETQVQDSLLLCSPSATQAPALSQAFHL